MSITPFPILDLGSDPHERGLEHGRRFAASVRHNLQVYLDRFAASGLSPNEARAEGERWDEAIARSSPDYGVEMRGLASGADISRAEAALLNARYEIAFTLFGKDARKADGPAAEPEGCTTGGLLPEATRNGHTMLIQNWDWLAAIRGHCLLVRVTRTDKPSMLFLTEAGIVGGKMGLNSAGIGLVENGLAAAHDGKHPFEKPFHVRCREVLEAETLNDAMLPVVQTKRTASANFIVGCASGEIVDLETSPDCVAPLHPKDGIITHSNHFLDPRHGASQMERLAPNTLFRAARLDRLLRAKRGMLDVASIRETLSDGTSHPHAICRHVDVRQPLVRQTMTLASVILDLDARMMWISEGPCESAHVAVPLADNAALAA